MALIFGDQRLRGVPASLTTQTRDMSTKRTVQPYSHWLYASLNDVISIKYPNEINHGNIKSPRVWLCIFLDNDILLFTPSDSEVDEQGKSVANIVEDMLDAQIKRRDLTDLQYLDLTGDEPLIELQSSFDGFDESGIKDKAILTILLSSSSSSVTGGSVIGGIGYGPITMASILADGSGVSTLGRTVADEECVKKVIAKRSQYIDQQKYWLTTDANLPALHDFAFSTIIATRPFRELSQTLEFYDKGFLLKKKGYAGSWLYLMPCRSQEAQRVMQGTIPQEVQHRRRKTGLSDPYNNEEWTVWDSFEVIGAFGMVTGVRMNGGRQEYRRILSGQTGRLNLAWLHRSSNEDTRILPPVGQPWL